MAKLESIKIDRNNIELFLTPSYARKIRSKFINSLKKEFSLTEFYSLNSPIILNRCNDRYNIIDGNHRMTAIKEILKERDKFFKIHVVIHNLDLHNEIKLFNISNITQKITKDDIIKANQDVFPLIKECLNNLNLTIYPNTNKIKIGTLLTTYFSYCNIKKNKFFESCAGNIFMGKLNEFTSEDISFLEDFLTFHESIFGTSRKSNFFKGSFINCCMKLFYKNKEIINNNKEKFIKIYKSCIITNREDTFRAFTKNNTTLDTKTCYELLGTILVQRVPINLGKFKM